MLFSHGGPHREAALGSVLYMHMTRRSPLAKPLAAKLYKHLLKTNTYTSDKRQAALDKVNTFQRSLEGKKQGLRGQQVWQSVQHVSHFSAGKKATKQGSRQRPT